MKQRMGDHKRSIRFKDDDFTIEILETSYDRSFIEKRESEIIKELDTFNNGLNESESGKGYGHNSNNFTTLGYIYTEEQRKNMSIAAKKRGGGPEQMRKLSFDQWAKPGMREKHSKIRKGKRLSPPKITDEEVIEIRKLYESVKEELEKECEELNKNRNDKNPFLKKD